MTNGSIIKVVKLTMYKLGIHNIISYPSVENKTANDNLRDLVDRDTAGLDMYTH